MITFEKAFPNHCLESVLRGARHKESLTQKQLAEKIGKSQSFISSIESGKIIPDDDILKLISKATKIGIKVFRTAKNQKKE